MKTPPQIKAGPESLLVHVSYMTGNILYCHLCSFPYFSETKLISCCIFLISAFFCFLSSFKAAGTAEALTSVRGEFAYANFTPLIKIRST